MVMVTVPKFAIAWVSNVNNNLQFYGFTRHSRILILEISITTNSNIGEYL